jgi:metal-sulfur cluster biosynthetic enzyme
MSVTDTALLDALKAVTDPNTGKDFVSTKQLKNLRIEDGDVTFDVELGYPAKSQIALLRKSLIAAARGVPGVQNVSANLATKITAHSVQRGVQLLPKVRTSSPSPRARAASARARRRSTWRSRWPPKARRWASSTPTSTAPVSR